MSATSTRLPLFNMQDSSLTSKVIELLGSTSGKWQGTASELCEALRLNAVPRSLSVQLKKCVDELQNAGVYVKYKKVHGRPIISLSTTVNVTQNLINGCTPTHSFYYL